MPPKRKAAVAAIEEDSPPLKRRLRSKGPLAETQPVALPPAPAPAPRRRAAIAAKKSIENIDVSASDEDHEHDLPVRRGRPRAKRSKLPSTKPATLPSPPITRRRAAASTHGGGGDVDTEAAMPRVANRKPGIPLRRGQTAKKVVLSPAGSPEPPAAGPVPSSSNVQLQETSEGQSALKRRVRGPRVAAELPSVGHFRNVQGNLKRASKPSTVIRGSGSHSSSEGRRSEEEPDELLLTPSWTSGRPVTPPRSTTPPRSGPSHSATGTPRYLIHSVQITTPSWLKNSSLRGVPSPGGSALRPLVRKTPGLNGTPRGIIPQIPFTPTRSRVLKTLQVSPKRTPAKATILEEEDEFDNFPVEIRSPARHTPGPSPTNDKGKSPASPSKFPHIPLDHLELCLRAQKRATLASLRNLPDFEDPEDDGLSPNSIALEQLSSLLTGTVMRGEGNSCLITGPRGSGKTHLVEQVVESLPMKAYVIRLSGYAQTNDRLAIREIAWQLAQQTGTSLIPLEEVTENPNPDAGNPFVENCEPIITLPPPAHLLALISVIPTLSHPTIIVLDAFDLFALHPRQSLLYCLFDTVQHSRVGANGKGLAVVGTTARVDTINLLEKRVKSRFSGRMLRTACPGQLSDWTSIARRALCSPIDVESSEEWTRLWGIAVDKLMEDKILSEALSDTFALTRNIRALSRILTPLIIDLTPTSPFPSTRSMAALHDQRCPASSVFLHSATYPSICLLIAATHAQTSGHDVFTFEMLHETFCDQVRTSISAPVQIEGGGIGMVRCNRDVLMAAFEQLVSHKALVAVSAPSIGTSKEFTRYRCTIDRADVKGAVEKMGQLSLKKWFSKAQ